MNYEEWLNIIDELKTSVNIDKLEKLKNEPINNNINDLLIPKLKTLVQDRFNLNVRKIINELDNIFSDSNILDLTLVSFKKELNIIKQLATLKQLPCETQTELLKMIKNESDKLYEILIKESESIDYSGETTRIINNNRIKWSD